MLQLKTKPFDICRISKLLAQYNIKEASISNQLIILKGEISDELLGELCESINICNVQNFGGEVIPLIQKETNQPESDETEVEDVAVKTHSDVVLAQTDLNMVQIQLLSRVDISELFKIAQVRASDKIKAENIIKLFGFDMQRNGVQYLFKAILISPKKAYFNLETLCDSVAKSEPDVGEDEIKRLIVARVKELFKFKKSPTIDFIRLVNSFLTKKEDEKYEKNNI